MSRCRSPACYDAQLADLVDFAFDRQAIEGFEPQASEEFDPGFERLVGITESLDFFRVRAAHSSGVRHAPMGGNRIPRPHRAGFTGGLVANGEDEIHYRRARFSEFIPAFAAQPVGIEMRLSSRSSASGCTTPLGKLPAL